MDLIDYGKSFIGVPYVWGGAHPAEGYDCSGFVQEVLASRGIDPPKDQTAQSLHDKLIYNGFVDYISPSLIKRNDILFFGTPNRITHVAIAVDGSHMLESGGGGSATKTIKDAVKHEAMVRVRPIRIDLLSVLRPAQQEMDL